MALRGDFREGVKAVVEVRRRVARKNFMVVFRLLCEVL